MTGIRIVVYGMGRVGSRITRHAIEKKAEVVAGYVRSVESQERLTQEFPGLEICLPDRPLRDHRADVLLIAHSGQYSEIYEVARRGAEAGMDVITLSNEGYDPFMLSEHLETSQLLHRIFRQAGRSMVSVGVQDMLWYAQPLSLALGAQKIVEMQCICLSDRGLFGQAAAADIPVGASEGQFQSGGHAGAQGRPGVLETGLRPLITALGLTLRQSDSRISPILAEDDLDLGDGRVIRAGTVCGVEEQVMFHTQEGPRIGGVFRKGYFPAGTLGFNEWTLHGEPDMRLRMEGLRGDILVAAAAVNRIPDVIAARPGMVRVDQLPQGRHVAMLPERARRAIV